jgi:hypothetical protein
LIAAYASSMCSTPATSMPATPVISAIDTGCAWTARAASSP